MRARVREAVRRSSHRTVAADVRPATTSSADAVGRDATDRLHALRDRTEVDGVGGGLPGRVASAGQDDVERAVDVDREPPPPAQVADRVPGDLVEPARQSVVAGEVGHVRERLAGMGDRDDVGRVAVVGEGPSILGAGGRHELATVGGRGQRDRPGTEDHQAGRAIGTDEVAEAPSERCIVGRPGEHPDVGRSGGLEPDPMALGDARSSGGDPALDGTGGRPGVRVQDSDGDRAHERESSRRRPMSRRS